MFMPSKKKKNNYQIQLIQSNQIEMIQICVFDVCLCVEIHIISINGPHYQFASKKKILEIQIVYSFFLFVCSSFDHRFFFFFCCCIRDISIDMINQSINQSN